MKMLYCLDCGKKTGHKRDLGFGTFFAVLVTGGLWLLAIPSYPLRCVVCGSTEVRVGGLLTYLQYRSTTIKSKTAASNDSFKTDKAELAENIEEYQPWAEEFIYKFNRVVTNISSNLGNPIEDSGVLTSFFDTIREKSLDTSRIRGFENKSAFEQTLLKAQKLFEQLEKTPEMQNHLRQQEEARLEMERLRTEKAAMATALKQRRNRKLALGITLYILSVIISIAVGSLFLFLISTAALGWLLILQFVLFRLMPEN